jgi:hypothetical protein
VSLAPSFTVLLFVISFVCHPEGNLLLLWLDPIDRVAYIYSSDGILKLTTTRLAIPNSEIFVDLPTLFAALD